MNDGQNYYFGRQKKKKPHEKYGNNILKLKTINHEY